MVGEEVTRDIAKEMREFMAANRVPLDPADRRRLSDLGHLRFIEALAQAFPKPTRRLTLHGGTSLHLIWGSPRFSEDLDFLLDRQLQPMISEIIPEIESRMRQALKSKDPGLNLTLVDKTRAGSNLLNFRATLSSKGHIGNAKIKAEFWQVDEDYLRKYDTRAFQSANEGIAVTLPQALHAATLESAYADKLVALSGRDYLKPRDLFDLWWIGNRIDPDPATMKDRFLHHATAYSFPDDLPPEQALRRFLEHRDEDIIAMTEPDMKKWLPERLWLNLKSDRFHALISYVRHSVDSIVAEIEKSSNDIVLGCRETHRASAASVRIDQNSSH